MYLRERMMLGFGAANPIFAQSGEGTRDFYGISIALIIHSLDPSLFTQLITRYSLGWSLTGGHEAGFSVFTGTNGVGFRCALPNLRTYYFLFTSDAAVDYNIGQRRSTSDILVTV